MSLSVIQIENLSKKYRIGIEKKYYSLRDTIEGLLHQPQQLLKSINSNPNELADDEIWALKDVNLSVSSGEVLGIIGANGAGKSTLLKIISRITPPTTGEIKLRRKVASLLEVGTGFHQELTGRENIFLNGSILGMKRKEIKNKFDNIVEFAAVEKFIDTPVKHYSSGMYVRLAFAIAAFLESEILIIDEVLAVGDAHFQKKSISRMREMSSKEGRTIILVSHNLSHIERICNRTILLEGGKVIYSGKPNKVISMYLNENNLRAEISWNTPEQAPGDDIIRLKSVKVLNKDKKTSGQIEITEPITIEIQYWCIKKSRPTAGIYVKNQDGIHLFTSFDFHNNQFPSEEYKSPGVYKTTCTLPGNFLTDGAYFVTPTVNSFIGVRLCHADKLDAISFEIIDQGKKDGVRGSVQTGWPGIVRPKLIWNITKEI